MHDPDLELEELDIELGNIARQTNSYEEYCKASQTIRQRIYDIHCQQSLDAIVELSEMEDIDLDCLMSMDDFIAGCKSGCLTDDDGFGLYATENSVSDIEIIPSYVLDGKYRKDFDYVCWYNK